MPEAAVNAYAKLNLTLDILRRREDGYHDLCMVMQSISLHDRIVLRTTESGGITLSCGATYLPAGRGNLAFRAAEAFFQATGQRNPGLHIDMEKTIPVCAGMAGGSSDAAAVLRGLRQLYAPEMAIEDLCRIGAQVGSDVPYCVFGGTALAEGRGEILTRLPPMPACWAVICKPPFGLSTPELFGCVQAKKLTRHPDTRGMLRSLAQGDLTGILHRIYNVFEEVLPEKYSEVFAIKDQLLDLGAGSAAMTGSGPTVFGLFPAKETAEAAFHALKERYGQTYLAEMVNAKDEKTEENPG